MHRCKKRCKEGRDVLRDTHKDVFCKCMEVHIPAMDDGCERIYYEGGGYLTKCAELSIVS